MGMDALKTALKEVAKGDNFELGTVIRWTAAGRYTYAAVKTEAGWYTTATATNTHVPQVLTFGRLLKVFEKEGVTEVDVAVEWTKVSSEG